MADTAPVETAESKALDKRTALAVLDLVQILLMSEAAKYELLGKEAYADGLDDGAILVGELRRTVTSWSVSQDYFPRALVTRFARLKVVCGKPIPAEEVRSPRPCHKALGHEGDCEP